MLNIMKVFKDILGISKLEESISDLTLKLESSKQLQQQLWADKNDALSRLFVMQQQYQKMTNGVSTLIDNLDTCKKLTESDKTTIENLQKLVNELDTKLSELPAKDVFNKPIPAILQSTDAKKVMLGDFVLISKQETRSCTYPDHPSVFMPCPVYESILTLADCNRRRDDLTPIQICKAISNVLQTSNSYVTDQSQWGRIDNWTPAVITRFLRRDDCESLSSNILSAILYYELKFGAFIDYTCLMGLGHFNTSTGSFGHGFVVIAHNTSKELKDSYIIEATDSFASEPMQIDLVKEKYWIDWGLIGFVNSNCSSGTYEVSLASNWWGTAGGNARMEENNGIFEKVKRVFGIDKDTKLEKAKRLALKEFAKERGFDEVK